ncbi:hypothetical protein [Saccharopolyspora gregorii]|uniref:Uncharacterized protein n=1 Tax=Saccharopolyspora gregorii TaxID=33914 RepID=A0ABP6RI93_9PSEU
MHSAPVAPSSVISTGRSGVSTDSAASTSDPSSGTRVSAVPSNAVPVSRNSSTDSAAIIGHWRRSSSRSGVEAVLSCQPRTYVPVPTASISCSTPRATNCPPAEGMFPRRYTEPMHASTSPAVTGSAFIGGNRRCANSTSSINARFSVARIASSPTEGGAAPAIRITALESTSTAAAAAEHTTGCRRPRTASSASSAAPGTAIGAVPPCWISSTTSAEHDNVISAARNHGARRRRPSRCADISGVGLELTTRP